MEYAIALVPTVVILALSIWLTVRVLHKAGYSGWWVLVILLPIANLVMFWIFAFAKWPALEGAKAQGSSGRVGGEGYASGGTIVDRGGRPEAPARAEPEPAAEQGEGRWMLSGFDGDGHAVRLEFTVAELEQGDGLVVGRSPKQSELVLGDGSVSRRHARLFASGGVIQVEDLDSSNGTTINGKPVEPGAPARLNQGDEIGFGETKLRVSNA